MGINLPPPAVVEFGKEPSNKKSLRETESLPPPEPKRRSSLLGKPAAPESRTVYAADPAANSVFKYPGNAVYTTKFTLFTFLPKGLYEQFRRIANFYFLLIAIISLTPVSPVNPITNVLPLVLVLAVSLAKEAFEDRKRSAKDREMNSRPVEVLREGSFVTIPWRDVQCGEIVKVKDREYFPADLVTLSSTNPEGVCYIETMNLDGETNLKMKKALKDTWNLHSEADLARAKAQVDCELPNSSLYTFTGNLRLDSRTLPLSPNQVLLRGCMLRNTESIYGVAIFTGHETKVMKNMTATPSKRSTLERQLDYYILLMFTLLACLCIVDAVGSAHWVDQKYWYLALGVPTEAASTRLLFDPANRAVVGLLSFLTAVTLFSSVIPISLYVSIELVKYFQAKEFIDKDRDMYYAATDTPALARTSNLNEELGQIQYIFSDKTGTLTCNMMEFSQCSIAGIQYGSSPGKVLSPEAAAYKETSFAFYDERLMGGAWEGEPERDHIREFLTMLAVCHTVLPEGEETPQSIKYQAASPDEAALVVAAKALGAFFFRRTPSTVFVRESTHDGREVDNEYELLAVLEFNSTRKRQSVIVRRPDGVVRLYCKGADNVISERLSAEGRTFWDATHAHLEGFGRNGLRTLCLAYRDISENKYQAWALEHDKAKAALVNRSSQVDAAAELIEVKLTLLGATAIEDRLQEGVGDCIVQLAKAGIKLWVLTGDKMETAINIGYACRLLTDTQRLCTISSEVPEVMAVEEKPFAEQDRVLRNQVKLQLAEAQRRALGATLLDPPQQVALIMDGKVLAILLERRHKQRLLALGVQCAAVICCRVSPLQKSQITRLVKEGAGQITLAIGDGANDVSMIQAAHVGVGISGQEGLQAVMTADFAIAQFRFLSDLLLVHGRWSYRRISKVVGYFFYKNTVFTLVQFWFNLYAAYSGQRFYDDWLQAFYNLLFTSLPVIVLGLLDQDVSKGSARQLPQLYREGQRNASFSVWVLLGWLLSALWQSLVVFYTSAWALSAAADRTGIMLGMWSSGTLAYTLIATIVNLRLLFSVCYHTLWHYAIVFGSIVFYYSFLAMYSLLRPGALNGVGKSDNAFFVIFELVEKPAFWLAMVLGVVTALLPDLAWQGISRAYFPSDANLIQEAEAIARGTEANSQGLSKEIRRSEIITLAAVSPDGIVTFGGEPDAEQGGGVAVKAHLTGDDASEAGAVPKGKAAVKPARKGIKFADGPPQPSTASTTEDTGTASTIDEKKKALPRRHTGYAFDHPGFESFHADEAERKMIIDRLHAVRASHADPSVLLTAHQAAVLERKVELVKRYSATEAMIIHAQAADDQLRASAENPSREKSVRTNYTEQGRGESYAGSHASEGQCSGEITPASETHTFDQRPRRQTDRIFPVRSDPNPETEDML